MMRRSKNVILTGIMSASIALHLGGCDGENEADQLEKQHPTTQHVTPDGVTYGSNGYHHNGGFYYFGTGPYTYLTPHYATTYSRGYTSSTGQHSSVVTARSSSVSRGGFGSTASSHSSSSGS